MFRFIKRRTHKSGLPPGTLVHVGDSSLEPVQIKLVKFDAKTFKEQDFGDFANCYSQKDDQLFNWIDISGVHDLSIFHDIADKLEIHTLVLEDIVNTAQRPKFEDHDEILFIVLKLINYDTNLNQLIVEQVSLILGTDYLLTFQENGKDIFKPLRERLQVKKNRVRSLGLDYLCFALMDFIVDHYFKVLEEVGEDMETMEENLFSNGDQDGYKEIHLLKKELIFFRKLIWPLREAIAYLERDKPDQIKQETYIYFRDLHDHLLQIIETNETFRDMLSSMLDLHLTVVNNRMNEVMKVLTLTATIFIPLTFIAGVYGMNFKFIPELGWHFGYFYIWGLMIFTGLSMFCYFKKKKWF